MIKAPEIGQGSLDPQPSTQTFFEEHPCLWDLFSAVVFPIGIARVTNYLVSKYIISIPVLPSLITSAYNRVVFGSEFSIEQIRNNHMGVEVSLSPYKTTDGVTIDAAMLQCPQQKNVAPQDQKWILVAQPNAGIYQNHLQDDAYDPHDLIRLASDYAVNVLCFNYRGTGPMGGPWPSSFEDLVEDADAGIRYLLSLGVDPKNILAQGLSLGGAVLINAAAKHQEKGHEMPVLIQNTFSALQTVAVHHVKGFLSDFHIDDPLYSIIAIKDLIGALPEFAAYVTYYFCSFIENLVTLHIQEAFFDAYTVVKTGFIEPLLVVIALVNLVCMIPILPWIYSLKDPPRWLAAPSIALCKASIYLNSCIATKETALALKLAKSTRLESFVKGFLSLTNWTSSEIEAYKKLRGAKLVTYAENDFVIPWEASLANVVDQQNVRSLGRSGHGATLPFVDRVYYQKFVRQTLHLQNI